VSVINYMLVIYSLVHNPLYSSPQNARLDVCLYKRRELSMSQVDKLTRRLLGNTHTLYIAVRRGGIQESCAIAKMTA